MSFHAETASIRATPHPADAPELETTGQLLAALANWLDLNGFELPDTGA